MAIKKFEKYTPIIDPTAWVDESAVVIGDVKIAADSSIWPHVVLRGDVNSIEVGERTSIQDNSVVHVTHKGAYHPEGFSTVIGSNVTIGHGVIVHGCKIDDHCLIGMGSIILDGVQIEPYVILGAGTLVPPGKIITGGWLWLGSPAKQIRQLTDEEKTQINYSANYYVQLKNRY